MTMRITVTLDHVGDWDVKPPILLDEEVEPEHLQDRHSAEQLMQRLGWAVASGVERERIGATL
jgi:hypothetical protein